jgi:hypothetical protein
VTRVHEQKVANRAEGVRFSYFRVKLTIRLSST